MPPYILLSLLLGATYGTLFHLWRGKSVRDLVIYFLIGIIGFGLGQVLGNLLGFNFLVLGPLHLVEATLVSLISLFSIQWLRIK